MQTYSEFQPTGFDRKGLGVEDHQDWMVAPVATSRDAGCLQRSNWEVVTSELAKVDPEGLDHEVHRFGHWANGWFEICLVRPGSACDGICEGWESALADYPVADDDHFSNLETEEAGEAWSNMRLGDRVRLLQKHGTPRYPGGPSDWLWVLQARHDYPPSDDNGSIQEYLLGH